MAGLYAPSSNISASDSGARCKDSNFVFTRYASDSSLHFL